MSSGTKDRCNDSLCEKSMKMVVNIVKLSSFSIAKMSLGVTGTPVSKNPAPVGSSGNQPLVAEIPGSRKSQELRMRKKPYSYVMQPDEGNGSTSSYVIHEDKYSVIDGMTSDYIRKFHEKNRYDALVHDNTAAKLSPFKPFPPSPAVK